MIRSVQAGCQACPTPACTFPYKRLFPVLFKLKTCGNSFSFKKTTEKFAYFRKKAYFCIAFETKERAFSSAGSEHLPYKQRVGGSNPSTRRFESVNAHNRYTISFVYKHRAFSSAGSEHLPYKQRVGGSNPSTPTRDTFQGYLFLYSFGISIISHPIYSD